MQFTCYFFPHVLLSIYCNSHKEIDMIKTCLYTREKFMWLPLNEFQCGLYFLIVFHVETKVRSIQGLHGGQKAQSFKALCSVECHNARTITVKDACA